MPIDMALPLYLSKEDFVFRTSPRSRDSSPSSCSGFQRPLLVEPAAPDDARPRRDGRRKVKKQVTFADHRGLSLTRVKIFSQFNDPIDIPVNITAMFRSPPHTAPHTAPPQDHLVLDFAQPSSDYLRFRQQLEQQLVCLERCVLKEAALAGTVKVRNVSFEKAVKLRVTFDTWRTHRDVDCVYVKDAYPNPYSDTFSFHVGLPERLAPAERVEFAVCYEVGGAEHWDSNHGENYRVVWSSMRREPACGRRSDPSDFGIHLDRYGSPTCSHGIFPDWPSYAGYEDSRPYY